jgi:hypothetical protein
MEGRIRPWYRSRLFWLGVPGIVFLVWGWLANVRNDFHISYRAWRGSDLLSWDWGTSLGSIYHSRSESNPGRGSKFKLGFSTFHETLEPDEPTIYFPLRPFGVVREPEYKEVWVAWWAIVLCYTLVWLGALIGWHRRKIRFKKRSTASPG